MKDRIVQVVEEVLRPLIEADGGELELLEVQDDLVKLRLGARFSGCPSAPLTIRGVIEPAIHKAAGRSIEVKVSST